MEVWASIKNSSEYKEAIEQSKQRTNEQTKQKTELQNLRMQINRLRQQGKDTEAEDLLVELWDKEESYGSGKKRPLDITTRPRSAHRRSASAGRAPRSRLEPDNIPPRPDRAPPSVQTSRARAASARRASRSRLEPDNIPPMPERVPPHVLNYRHEITQELDVDWTLCPEDPAKELRLRAVRNEMLKEQLQRGNPVIYRSSGWSLYPRVRSNDRCSYEPVTSAHEVHQDDIVFCQVQPGDRFYGHLVSRKWFEEDEWWFNISNAHGRENGWCSIKNIYGRLIRVEH